MPLTDDKKNADFDLKVLSTTLVQKGICVGTVP